MLREMRFITMQSVLDRKTRFLPKGGGQVKFPFRNRLELFNDSGMQFMVKSEQLLKGTVHQCIIFLIVETIQSRIFCFRNSVRCPVISAMTFECIADDRTEPEICPKNMSVCLFDRPLFFCGSTLGIFIG